MRTLSAASAIAAAAVTSLLFAPAAYATPPGDNGTVKIHDATTGEKLRKNEPHVCSFYLDGFGFDGSQQVDWKIVEMPPTGTKGTVATSGALTLDVEGDGRSDDLSLPDGHYKLIWNFDGEHGRAKHKVFWTACEDDGEQGGQPSGKPGGKPSGKPTAEPTASASASAAAPAPSAQGRDDGRESGGDLAETGASVTGVSVAAAALLGAGGGLMLWRRTRGQG
ncbi:LPXTG cell wall anchor domain-containing protein [Streptomyces sp. 8N706]|uniref:LPXTG cell wall anchor domain-containing protein n=1 Tax=Streptomyces sp. 8N706 TaxID=3457416 RepID=UPI003FD456E9